MYFVTKGFGVWPINLLHNNIQWSALIGEENNDDYLVAMAPVRASLKLQLFCGLQYSGCQCWSYNIMADQCAYILGISAHLKLFFLNWLDGFD